MTELESEIAAFLKVAGALMVLADFLVAEPDPTASANINRAVVAKIRSLSIDMIVQAARLKKR